METSETCGAAYTLGLPLKVTALRKIMIHAEDWFDEWERGFYATPGGLNAETFQKLYTKCEGWARKKELYDDTAHQNAMDLGNVNTGGGSESQGYEYYDCSNADWDVPGWVDESGDFYPDDPAAGWGERGAQQGGVDAVGKGKGKGKCFNCGETGHLAKDCKKPKRTFKGSGKGTKGGGKGGKGGYRTNLMGYLKGKYGGKAQGRSGQGKGFVPICQRACFMRGGRGHLAKDCTWKPANEVQQGDQHNDESTMLGEPLELVEVPGDNAPPPPNPCESEEKYVFQRNENKRIKKYEKWVTRFNPEHECGDGCLHADSWNGKFNDFARNEKDVINEGKKGA